MKWFAMIITVLLSFNALADAGEIATGSLTVCSLRGTFAGQVIAAKSDGQTKEQSAEMFVQVIVQTILDGMRLDRFNTPIQQAYLGLFASFATEPGTIDQTTDQMLAWAGEVYDKYDDVIQGSIKERLHCEKHAAGEE